MEEKKYPVAEIFNSPQGEGQYTGTLMTFIRFAGCSVGKKLTPGLRQGWMNRQSVFAERIEIPIYTEQCCTYDGRPFLCDTDFRTKEVLTVGQIIERIPKGMEHVCLTGGEPLIHDLEPLVTRLKEMFDDDLGVKYHMPCIHVETSGTIDWPEYDFDTGYIWLTVSPKFGVLEEMLEFADEVKILVDENFDESKLPAVMQNSWAGNVYIQPINAEFAIDDKNMQRVLELQKKHPSWKISSQMHKIWHVR